MARHGTSFSITNVPSKSIVRSITAVTLRIGRAVAQAVSRWLPTVAARVRVRAACGICGGQSGIGAGFLRVLWFTLPIIPPISPSS
jgi:ABC-type Co2+ transport system permease subunit